MSWAEWAKMSNRVRVLHVLRGPEASRIRFTFPAVGGPITVNHMTFDRVARAIEDGDIHISVTKTFPPGVYAQYDSSTNTILTPPVIGRVDAGMVLHECTHAAFDLARTAVSALDDEAAAYVVDALYFRMTGLPRPRWAGPAGSVAGGLLHHYALGTRGIPAVDPVLWATLRIFTSTLPIYLKGPAGTGGSYTHDG